MEHKLQSIQKHHDLYIKHHNKLIETLLDFEVVHDLPVGINIQTENITQIQQAIIPITIRPTRELPEAKYHYDTKIHPVITKELHLKLIRTETNITHHQKGKNKKYTYYYTYIENPIYEEIEVEDTIM